MEQRRSLVYVSTSKIPQASVHEGLLFLQARDGNGHAGMSGFLHHEGGKFAQYVEGPADAVDALIRKLQKDWRHDAMKLMRTGEDLERRFPKCNMPLPPPDAVSFAIRHWQRGRPTEMDEASADDLLEYFIFCANTPQMHTW